MGNKKSCGCIHRAIKIDFTGCTLGRLKIIERTGKSTKEHSTMWKALCSCGTMIEIGSRQIRRGFPGGCEACEKKYGATIRRGRHVIDTQVRMENYLYSRYVNGAKRRNIFFDLTRSDFVELIKKECHYCGGLSEKESGIIAGNVPRRYNGLDRKDNIKGYIKENVVPCCLVCNFMKRNLGEKDFLQHLVRILKHSHAQGRI
jgi:hypothetical protein